MTVELTASHDACQASAYVALNDTTIWLQPRRITQRTSSASHSRTLLRLTASIGMGAFLTFATASAAKAPSGSLEDPGNLQILDQDFPSPTAMPAVLRSAIAVSQLTTQIVSIEPAPVRLTGGYDPLQIIVPAEPVETADLQAQIIASKAPLIGELTSPIEKLLQDDKICIQFEEHCVPRWLVDTILRAADAAGVDPVYMMALADKESSFAPSAKAGTSSATGLFQFIAGTWLQVIQEFGSRHGMTAEAAAIRSVDGQLTVIDQAMREHILGLRNNAYVAALMAAEMTKRDRNLIESRIGRSISRSEFYFAHFFGVDSASRFMRLVDNRPKQSAQRVFPAAAKANRTLFFKKAGRKTRQLTISEVYDKIDAMIDRRLGVYEDVASLVFVKEKTSDSNI
ncbi:transglycosylase SLT domain-containing protein [Microvirga sp. 2MCAF38]|uniref:transglycosylase SLT domain-containing protein n=1 Tax=Microvirga sp. 2MCAF38 TaxID=3232989 RepID=UPI003F95EB93